MSYLDRIGNPFMTLSPAPAPATDKIELPPAVAELLRELSAEPEPSPYQAAIEELSIYAPKPERRRFPRGFDPHSFLDHIEADDVPAFLKRRSIR